MSATACFNCSIVLSKSTLHFPFAALAGPVRLELNIACRQTNSTKSILPQTSLLVGPTISSELLSKQHLQRKLILPRTPHSARNRAGSRRADPAVGQPEIWVIKEVERFHAELQPHSLRNRNALE